MEATLPNEENTNWKLLLNIFHKIYDSKPSDAKTQYEALKGLAKTKNLSPRQMDGIISRCDNAINGEYGNTKTEKHLSQEHNFSQNGKH